MITDNKPLILLLLIAYTIHQILLLSRQASYCKNYISYVSFNVEIKKKTLTLNWKNNKLNLIKLTIKLHATETT